MYTPSPDSICNDPKLYRVEWAHQDLFPDFASVSRDIRGVTFSLVFGRVIVDDAAAGKCQLVILLAPLHVILTFEANE